LDLLASDCLGQLDDLLSPGVPAMSNNDDWTKLFGRMTETECAQTSSLDLDLNMTSVFGDDVSTSGSQASFLPSQLLDQFTTLQLDMPLQPDLSSEYFAF